MWEGGYLVGNMRPVMLTPQRLEVLLKQSTHLNNSIRHALDFTQPLGVQRGVVHDGRGDAGAVDRRVRVEWTNEDLDLRLDAFLLFGVFADEGECPDTFAVEALFC